MRNAFKPNVWECNDCTLYNVAITSYTKNKNAIKRDNNKFIQAYVFSRTPLFSPFCGNSSTLPHKDALLLFIKPDAYIHEKKKREQYKDTLLSSYNIISAVKYNTFEIAL